MAIYPQPIPDRAIDLTPALPEFQQSFHDTMGNAGDPSDGFDSIIAPIFDHVQATGIFLSGFDSSLLDIGASVNDLATPFHQDAAAALAVAISGGQPAFDTLSSDLAGGTGGTPTVPGTPAPTPTPQPAPAPTTIQVTLQLDSRPTIDNPKVLFQAELIE